MLQKPHRHCTDGGSRRQGREKRLLFIFILTSPCRHSSPSVAFSYYIETLDRAQISALPCCSRIVSIVVLGLRPCPTTSGIAVHQLHKPPGKNLSSCMGLLSQRACICLLATEWLHCISPSLGHISLGLYFPLISVAEITQQLAWQPRANWMGGWLTD